MRFGSRLLVVCSLVAAATGARAAIDARLLRYPDVSADRIAFVYAGDIWIVPKDGGTAQRLSTPRGEESFPRFSPDGSRLAFSGNYDGNEDLYVVPSSGGNTRRLTHHPAEDRVLDWYPDGRSILFASPMESGTDRFNQFFRISPEGGMPDKLPLPYGEFGTIAADGHMLAYTPITLEFRTWKRYRGGMAPDIWLFDLERKTSRRLTEDTANDALPMWQGSKVYFLSDRGPAMRANLWVVDTAGGQPRQLTSFTDFDCQFPAIGPRDIVFSNGADLWLLDLQTEKTRKVPVEVVTDRATLRPRMVSVTEDWNTAAPSPSGKRVIVGARGELFTVPAEHGFTLDLSHSSGFAERYPAWSPDGEWIAYFSDRSGEYELTLRPADGSGEEQKLTSMGPGFRYQPHWSPDSKKLAFVDQAMRIWLYDRDAKKLTEVDHGLYMFHGALANFRVSWSPDSRWFAFGRALEQRNGAIFLYDTRGKKLHQVTSGFYDDDMPEFDPTGKYLYFLSGRTFDPIYSDLDNTWIYSNTGTIVAVPLRADVASPVGPRNDAEGDEDKKDANEGDEDDEDEGDKDENGKDKSDDDDDDDGNGKDAKDDKKDKPEPVEIDLEGFEQRLVVLPAKPGNYADLTALEDKLLYRRVPRTGSTDEENPIVVYDLEEREEKIVLADADGFEASADGKKLLVGHERKLALIEPKPDQKMDEPLDLSGLQMELDPPAEWRQIFTDSWRFERDYFYDPNLHGVDWVAMRERYGALLREAVTRWDVNYLIGEMISELNASHTYRGGGDTEEPVTQGVGLLGADFALEQGAFRIRRIIEGAAWDNAVRSPLREPGVNVKEGDWLLAVNGKPLDPSSDPWAPLAGLAGKTVQLTVNDKPKLEGARTVVVKTLEDEFRLRNLAWIENNRRKVDEASRGRVGYVYVPSTGLNGQTELIRMLRGQFTKDALIIDERFNSGGQIPDRFVEILNRPIYNYWKVRDGRDWQWPPVAHVGPKVMLINGWSGSGGDAFPFYFREAGLGPLIGTRTWGGLIGISGAPGLIDGGVVTVPTFGLYSKTGQWIIEGYGVDPDIEVVDDPAKMLDGGDPQLERAIEEALQRLEGLPPRHPTPPPYTIRTATGIGG